MADERVVIVTGGGTGIGRAAGAVAHPLAWAAGRRRPATRRRG
ncbi:hypothetical protein ACFWOB_19705 [Streptomyces sp. NPDC058420]